MNKHSEQILVTLRQIIRAIDLHSKNLTRKYGLTGPQLLVLKELYKDNTLTLGQVASNVSLSQATVTSILDRLEKMEFVMRIRNTTDKRKVNIKLEEKTVLIMDSDPSLLQEEFTKKFEALDDWEKNYLLSALQRISSMMKAEDINSPPVLVSGPLAATEQDVNNFLDDPN